MVLQKQKNYLGLDREITEMIKATNHLVLSTKIQRVVQTHNMANLVSLGKCLVFVCCIRWPQFNLFGIGIIAKRVVTHPKPLQQRLTNHKLGH